MLACSLSLLQAQTTTPPNITSIQIVEPISPNKGYVGTEVRIRGANFSANVNQTEVRFGNSNDTGVPTGIIGKIKSIISTLNGKEIKVYMPPNLVEGSLEGYISVIVNGMTVFSDEEYITRAFNLRKPSQGRDISQSLVATGAEVLIRVEGAADSNDNNHWNEVSFDDGITWVVASINYFSSGRGFYAVVPDAAAESGRFDAAGGNTLKVRQNDGNTIPVISPELTTVSSVAILSIADFTPTAGRASSTIRINGTGFREGGADTDITVTFGEGATVTANLGAVSSQIVATVPSGAESGPITVTINGVSVTSADSFTFLELEITGVPFSQSIGGEIRIIGTGFANNQPGRHTVTFRQGVETTPTAATATELTVIVPSGVSTNPGPIEVFIPGVGRADSPESFRPLTLTYAPYVAGSGNADHDRVLIGKTLFITGSGFVGSEAYPFSITFLGNFSDDDDDITVLTGDINTGTYTTVVVPIGARGGHARINAGGDQDVSVPFVGKFTPEGFVSTQDQSLGRVVIEDLSFRGAEFPLRSALPLTSVDFLCNGAAANTAWNEVSFDDGNTWVTAEDIGTPNDFGGKELSATIPLGTPAGERSLWIRVHDGTTLHAEVESSNQFTVEGPSFVGAPYTFPPQDENTSAGTLIGTVNAEGPVGVDLVYSLMEGGDRFEIDGASGEITNKVLIDYEALSDGSTDAADDEQTNGITVTVQVSESSPGVNSATTDVMIMITDVNETPVFGAASYNFTQEENATPDTTLGTVTATDPDAGASLTYSLVTGGDRFEINGSGEITNKDVIDFDVLTVDDKAGFTVKVQVSDGKFTIMTDVTIRITDVNEAPSFAGAPYTFPSQAENTAAGTLIGTVNTMDPEGATLTYSLTDDASGRFSINASGEISNAVEIDYDVLIDDEFTVTVRVVDGTFTITTTAMIMITNVDEAPSFDLDTYTFTQAENTTADAVIGRVAAMDPDAGASLTYSLTDASGLFEIDDGTGDITNKNEINYEVLNSTEQAGFTVTVRVVDGTFTITITATIRITNVDEKPVFTSSNSFEVEEDATLSDNIGPVSATDPEGAGLTYSIDPLSDLFEIDGTSGLITLQSGKSLDFEGGTTEYTLMIHANAGGEGTDQVITITVTDVNEAPVFNVVPILTQDENTAASAIGTVDAADPDAGASLIYSLADASGFFEINASGRSKHMVEIDYDVLSDVEKTNGITVTVQVTDGTNPAVMTDVMIVITDVNEAPSFGVPGGYTFVTSTQRSCGHANWHGHCYGSRGSYSYLQSGR